MDRIVLHVYYNGEKGKAAQFVREMVDSGLQKMVKEEKGCIQYDYFAPIDDECRMVLLEGWKDNECLEMHKAGDVMAQIKAMKEKYDLATVIERYE